MTVATLETVNLGTNVFGVDVVQASGSGIILPQYRPGTVTYGDASSEFVYCKYVSVANQVLSPGLLFAVDDDFNATLLTTTNSPRGSAVMVCAVGMGNYGASVTTVTGSVYYLWLARSGQFPVAYTTAPGTNVVAETTATGGAANFPATPTVGSKLIVGLYQTKAPGGTFTGTTTNGSAFVSVAPGQITIDSGPVWVGSTVAGTGIPASTTILSLSYSAANTINGFTMSANATASGAVTITNSLVAQTRVYWPYIDKTN